MHQKMKGIMEEDGRVDQGKTPRFNIFFKFVEATVCAASKFLAHLPTDEEVLYQ